MNQPCLEQILTILEAEFEEVPERKVLKNVSSTTFVLVYFEVW